MAKEWRCRIQPRHESRIQPRHEISKSAQHPLHDQCGSHWWYEDDSQVKRDGDCNVDDNDGRRWRRILVWLSCDRFLQLRLRSCKLEHVDWCRKLRLMDRCQCLPTRAGNPDVGANLMELIWIDPVEIRAAPSWSPRNITNIRQAWNMIPFDFMLAACDDKVQWDCYMLQIKKNSWYKQRYQVDLPSKPKLPLFLTLLFGLGSF